jgi:hypothetical protein
VRVVRNATHASEDESRAARIALLPGLESREQAHLRQALDHLPHVHDMLDQLLALRRMRSGGEDVDLERDLIRVERSWDAVEGSARDEDRLFQRQGPQAGDVRRSDQPGQRDPVILGVRFLEDRVAKVRITSGNTKLGPNERRGRDLVVMDDFIFGEPTP